MCWQLGGLRNYEESPFIPDGDRLRNSYRTKKNLQKLLLLIPRMNPLNTPTATLKITPQLLILNLPPTSTEPMEPLRQHVQNLK